MKALCYEAFQQVLSIRQLADPVPERHGVVVKVTATGLCRSDWHGWMGHDADIRLPHVPGHELAGTIEAIGRDVHQFGIGDRVTVPFVCGCGSCGQCISGNHQVCDHQSQPGFTHWGSFAEYVRIDYAATNLVKLPDEIDDLTAATLGCRFITSYRAVVAQGKVSGGQFVVVHGCGGVGLSAIMIANALGAQVIAVDINEHVSIDALGSQATCFNSIANLRKRGKHIQVGLMTGDHQHPRIPMDLVIANELEIFGSHGMQAFKYPEMLEMIKCGKLQPQKLIENTISLKDAISALPNMDKFRHKGVSVINSF